MTTCFNLYVKSLPNDAKETDALTLSTTPRKQKNHQSEERVDSVNECVVGAIQKIKLMTHMAKLGSKNWITGEDMMFLKKCYTIVINNLIDF